MSAKTRNLERRRHAQSLLLCLVLAAWSPGTPAAEWRIAGAYDAGTDIERLALAWPVRAPVSRADRIEIAVGVLASTGDQRPFVSVGPVFRLSPTDAPLCAEFSLSPTLLAGSTQDGLDLGGNFHFTSALAIGWSPDGRRAGITLRLAHVSNGGLHRRNPGLDTVGLAFTFAFDDG